MNFKSKITATIKILKNNDGKFDIFRIIYINKNNPLKNYSIFLCDKEIDCL